MHTISDKKILMLRPSEIILPDSALRSQKNGYSLKCLCESIAANGIIEPLNVRKNDNGKYELISGERRLFAAKRAGLRRVPCIVHKISTDKAAFYRVICNIQRDNLSYFEEAKALKNLIVSHRLTYTEISLSLGVTKSVLAEKLRILRLNEELQKRIIENAVSESIARSLLRLPPEKRENALDKIIAENMTAMRCEEFITEILNPEPKETPKKESKPFRKSAIGDIRLFSNSLSKLLESLKNGGVEAYTRRYENDRYIEYKVRIKKDLPECATAEQLKIC